MRQETVHVQLWSGIVCRGGFHHPQVLPDWKKSQGSSKQKHVDEPSLSVQHLHQFMGTHADIDDGKKKLLGTDADDEYESNRHNLKAFDHAMSSVNLPLSLFVPDRSARALGPREIRYSLSKDQWPDGFANLVRRRRSCIKNEGDGQRFIEAPVNDADRELHIVLDRGPCSWPMAFYLTTKMGALATFTADPPHMFWTDVQGAVKASGLWTTYLEVSLVCSAKGGPWHGCAWLNTMEEAAADYFKNVDLQNDLLFQELFVGICENLHMINPMSFGTDEHMAEVRIALKTRLLKMKKGFKVKPARWFSYFDCAAEMEDRWYLDLFILLYLGMRSKWWKTIEDTPLQCSLRLDSMAAEEAVVEAPAAAASSSDGPRTVRNSDEEIKNLRKSCKNQLMVCCAILCKKGTRGEMAMMNAVIVPLRENFGKMVVMHKTRKGSRQWAIEASQSGFDQVLQETMAVALSPSTTFRMGIQHVTTPLPDHELAIHLRLAEKSLEFARNLLKVRVLSLGLNDIALPGKFCGLIHHNPVEVDHTLEYLHELWESLQKAEVIALTDPWMKEFLVGMTWPHMPWVRNILVALWECDWEFVPADVIAKIFHYATSFRTTKSVEDGFNVLRDVERESKRGSLCPRTAWHRLLRSDISQDCDRPRSVVGPFAFMSPL